MNNYNIGIVTGYFTAMHDDGIVAEMGVYIVSNESYYIGWEFNNYGDGRLVQQTFVV